MTTSYQVRIYYVLKFGKRDIHNEYKSIDSNFEVKTLKLDNEELIKGNDWILAVDMPGVKYIPDNCFDSCERLQSVIIGPECTDIGESAFQGCKELSTIGTSGNPKYSFDNYILYENKSDGSYEINTCLPARGTNGYAQEIWVNTMNDPKLDPYAVWTFEEYEGGFAIKNVQTGQYMGPYRGDEFEKAPLMSDVPTCYQIETYADDATMVTLCQKGATSLLKADQANMAVLNHSPSSDKQNGWTLRQINPVEPIEDGNVIKDGYYHIVSAYAKFEKSSTNGFKRAVFCSGDNTLEWGVYYKSLLSIAKVDNRTNPAYLWHITKNEDGTYYLCCYNMKFELFGKDYSFNINRRQI